MPGAFQPFSLPALPSPATGIPTGGNPLAAALQAFAQFPQQQQQAQEFKTHLEQEKLAAKEMANRVEEQNYQRAMLRLGLAYRRIAGDQTGASAHDQNLIKAVEAAAKEANLGTMTMVDPTTGAQAIDLNALKHVIASKLYSEVDPQTRQELDQAAPGAMRAGIYARAGVDPATVPEQAMNSPSYMSEANKEKAIKDFTAKIADFTTGKLTLSGLNVVLQTMSPILTGAGVTLDQIKQMMASPEFNQNIGVAVQAKIDQLRKNGVKDMALAKYYTRKAIDEPRDIASKIDYRNGMLVVAQTNATTRRDQGAERLMNDATRLANDAQRIGAYVRQVNSNIQSANTTRGLNALRISSAILKNQLDPLVKQRDALVRQENDYVLNNKDIPDDLVQTVNQLNQQIDDATATQDTATAVVRQMFNANQTRASGKPTVQLRWEPPRGYTQHTTNGGKKKVWVDPKTNRVFDEDGNFLGTSG